MELEIEHINNSLQLEGLKNICNPIISGYPAINYFSEYMGTPENKTIHFNFFENGHLIIVGELRKSELVLNPRSFVNSLYISKLSQPLEEYLPQILSFYKTQKISKIRIRTAPPYIQYSEKLFGNSLLEYRCTTSIVDLKNYEVSSRRIRSLKKAQMMD